jgi:hypothetical protein
LNFNKIMENRQTLKNKILEIYNKININNPDKINLENKAKDLKDPFLTEYKKEIDSASKNFKEGNFQSKSSENTVYTLELIEITDADFREETIEIKTLDKIEGKVLNILNQINLGLYKYCKKEIKLLIIEDMLKTYVSPDLSGLTKNKITRIIANIVEHEFNEHENKKTHIREDLLKSIINLIKPELDNFFSKYTGNKLENLTKYQRKNIINFFIDELGAKFLDMKIIDNQLNADDLAFLKSKIRLLVLNRYNNLFTFHDQF